MSILFVLLTFLLILTVMYFRRPQEAADALQVAPAKKLNAPVMLKHGGFEVPEGYCLPSRPHLGDGRRPAERARWHRCVRRQSCSARSTPSKSPT